MTTSADVALNKNETDYELLYTTKVNGVIPIHKYKSKKSALKVILAEVDGPVVNGYFVLATEAHDDDGLPHTLEHLIFLGSESYPYKGMLDILANRCLASGTNAWTDVDHTCYTMTTAGSEGFLALLPIYVDHILNPLLTDSGFITEVHHVNGEGEDSGVVYCEMQGCENTGETRLHNSMLKAMYPGHCGYKSVTGGLLKNLRESTTNEKVRKYHKAFYRTENLVLVITGRVEASQVFQALKPVEDTIIVKYKKSQTPFSRPWQSAVPPLMESIDQLIPYPCEEEEKGMVWLAWRGPSCVYQLYETCALMMLMEYLTDTAVSPLQKTYVETTEPLASKVGYSFIENSESIVYLAFENVPVNKLGEIQPKLFSVMEPYGNGSEPLDMKRMQLVIRRRMLEQLSHLENNPHDTVAFMAVGDILYGRSHEDFRRRVNPMEDLKALAKESPSFWNDLILRYILGRPCVLTQGMPSKKEMEAYTTQELERLETQRSSLGSEGLAMKAEELAGALEHNDRQAPVDLIMSVPIPDINSISYHSIQRYCNRGEIVGCSRFSGDLERIPVRFQLDDVKTQFVYLYALMDTSLIPSDQRLYLPLLMNCLPESAIMRNGKLVSYETVVAQLSGDTVKTHSALGVDASDADHFFCGSYCNVAVLMLQLEREKYTEGICWLSDLLRQTVFTAERVKVIASKMANDVARIKRKGNKMALALIRNLVFDGKSNHAHCSLIRQQHFLHKLVEELNRSPERIIRALTDLRDAITSPNCLTIHMAAEIESLPDDAISLWNTHMFADWQATQSANADNDGLINLVADYQLLKEVSSASPMGAALCLGAVESCFLIQAVRSIDDIQHPDLAAVLVALQYLGQLEGPFWRNLRAQGLVYGYNLNLKVSEGLLYLSLYRASHPVVAFKEARSILENHARSDTDDVWELSLLESARSSLIFELVEREKTVGDAVHQSVRSYLSNASADYNRQLIHRVAAVTMEQMRRAFRLHLTALLDTEHCRCSIICHPSKLDELVTGINALGQPVHGYTSMEDCPLGQSC